MHLHHPLCACSLFLDGSIEGSPPVPDRRPLFLAETFLLAFPCSYGRESTLKDTDELALGKKDPSFWKGEGREGNLLRVMKANVTWVRYILINPHRVVSSDP